MMPIESQEYVAHCLEQCLFESNEVVEGRKSAVDVVRKLVDNVGASMAGPVGAGRSLAANRFGLYTKNQVVIPMHPDMHRPSWPSTGAGWRRC